ncbi:MULTISPECIES: ATP-grasp domain-containing protein [Paenibacillus]|uniref:ATP-grasp domain-containing protein n=1 Tax=Paenibacillus alvei TaxID=44250 RepID=A0ABT4EEF9_PAEAL|nr:MULTISPECIES: ATP-grasp domain-containing protein [Paenibacillus]MCY9532124.1 ATP-grasp domain-containing protein [Paenibacillus alvei]SDE52252.1 ATP-grasp domain-containing protein [Paenibacillus sp. cl6col]
MNTSSSSSPSNDIPRDGRRTVLITGSRSPVSLELARLLGGAGHRIIMADSLLVTIGSASRFVTRHYCYPPPRHEQERFLAMIERIVIDEQVDCVIPTCEEVFYLAQRQRAWPNGCELFAPPWELLKQLHHKGQFIEMIRQAGLHAPSTQLLTSQAEACGYIQTLGEDAAVLKPAYSRFASRVLFVRAGYALPDDILITPDYPWVGQQYIRGTLYCTYSIVRDGSVRAHACYPSEFTVGAGASIAFKHEPQADLLAWVQRFVAPLRYTGQIAFDFIVTPEQNIYPIECNPRATSGVHCFTASDQLDKAFFEMNGGRNGDTEVGMDGCTNNTANQNTYLNANFDANFDANLGEHHARAYPIEPTSTRPAMLTLAMLAYGWRSPQRGYWLRELWKGRDVIFRWQDPKPFVAQAVMLYRFWRESKKRSVSLIEATTSDIEWNGESS